MNINELETRVCILVELHRRDEAIALVIEVTGCTVQEAILFVNDVITYP